MRSNAARAQRWCPRRARVRARISQAYRPTVGWVAGRSPSRVVDSGVAVATHGGFEFLSQRSRGGDVDYATAAGAVDRLGEKRRPKMDAHAIPDRTRWRGDRHPLQAGDVLGAE